MSCEMLLLWLRSLPYHPTNWKTIALSQASVLSLNSLKGLSQIRLNELDTPLQSAYKAGHSTALHAPCVTVKGYAHDTLVLLDLSAAFDTINHDTLTDCLASWFGISEPWLTGLPCTWRTGVKLLRSDPHLVSSTNSYMVSTRVLFLAHSCSHCTLLLSARSLEIIQTLSFTFMLMTQSCLSISVQKVLLPCLLSWIPAYQMFRNGCPPANWSW